MKCLTSARYSMTADFYEQVTQQDESGAIDRAWDYGNPVVTVDCFARGIVDGGIRVAGSTERWESKYTDVEWVHIATQYKPTKRQRVGNIKNRQGDFLYDEGTIFEILGATPITNPFGHIIEYDVLAIKADEK